MGTGYTQRGRICKRCNNDPRRKQRCSCTGQPGGGNHVAHGLKSVATAAAVYGTDDHVVAVVNPGAGPVNADTYPDKAAENMELLLADVRAAAPGRTVTFEPLFDADGRNLDVRDEDYRMLMGGDAAVDKGYEAGHDGRYPFAVTVDGTRHVVEMPGLPADEVTFRGDPGQNAWDYPRLYVNGSSWLWKYAVNSLTKADGDYS